MIIKSVDTALDDIEKRLRKQEASMKDVLRFQELNYQRGVLCTLCGFMLSAKPMAEKGKFSVHAKMLDKFASGLLVERRHELSGERAEACTAALEEFQNVYKTAIQRFVNGYEPTDAEQYADDVKSAIAVVCSVFQAYRNTYLG